MAIFSFSIVETLRYVCIYKASTYGNRQWFHEVDTAQFNKPMNRIENHICYDLAFSICDRKKNPAFQIKS